ncbi:MAG: hypothetical protein K2Q22_12525 [Cytophagales bacterium]|nr:hypothetical protein [Cytophagales bacterium]
MSKETIYYVIIGIVYLYFQYAKWKKANPPKSVPSKATKKSSPTANYSSPTPTLSSKPKKRVYSADDDEVQKYQRPVYERLEDTQFTYDSPVLVRAAAEKKVDSVNPYEYNSSVDLPKEQRKFLFSEYTTDKKPNVYAEKLKNPASVKEAFIFAEILNKKYT